MTQYTLRQCLQAVMNHRRYKFIYNGNELALIPYDTSTNLYHIYNESNDEYICIDRHELCKLILDDLMDM